MSSTSRWESSVTRSPCDPGGSLLFAAAAARLSAALVSLRGSRDGEEEEEGAGPGSTSFPVEILLTPHQWRVHTHKPSCCRSMFLMLLVSLLFFTHYEKNKYYFVRFVRRLGANLGFLTICHISIMAAVFALCFVNILLFL